MGTLKDLTKVIEQAQRQVANTGSVEFTMLEEVNPMKSRSVRRADAEECVDNIMYYGDNIRLLKSLAEREENRGKLKLIYIDPPFFSEARYDAVIRVSGSNIRHPAYDDKWQQGLYGYLRQLTARLILMRELLADDGLIWLHLDWHVVHYARIIMDELFGEKNFVNEIIWTYKSGGSGRRRFARKHDNILVYSKTKHYTFNVLKEKSYNRQFKPYRFKGVKEYRDELGWYTMVNMKDVWHIDMVGRTSAERTGYATQKPEQLLERIVECCTEPGDLCADFFCGSGTLPAVAARMGRSFIACDRGRLAVESTIGRLCAQGAGFRVYAEEPEHRTEGIRKSRFEAEVHMSMEGFPGSDKSLVTIRLGSVREHRLPPGMEEKSRTVIRKAVRNSPLDLIEAWSVDFDYDGRVHRPSAVFVRNKKGLEDVCQQIVGPDCRRICVKIADVMGNVFYVDRPCTQIRSDAR